MRDRGVEGLAAVGLVRRLGELERDADPQVVAGGQVDLDRLQGHHLAGLGRLAPASA